MNVQEFFSAKPKEHGQTCSPETTGPTGLSGQYCSVCKVCIAGANGLSEHEANGHR